MAGGDTNNCSSFLKDKGNQTSANAKPWDWKYTLFALVRTYTRYTGTMAYRPL